jgi:hypothetical protein
MSFSFNTNQILKRQFVMLLTRIFCLNTSIAQQSFTNFEFEIDNYN